MTDYFEPNEISNISQEVFSLLMDRGISEEELIIFFISGTTALMLKEAGYNSSEINPKTDEQLGDALYEEIEKTGKRFINKLG